MVVDSSSIEVNRRLRRAKSDRLDARKLLGMLLRYHAGERACGAWCGCPRWRRRIGASCIASSGLEAGTHAGGEPDERPAREPGPLAAAGHRRRGACEDGAPVGRLARARGAAGPAGAGMGARAIPAHADSASWSGSASGRLPTGAARPSTKVRQLLRLRAVGPTGAWVYVNEFFGWRRFRNRKEVGAAAGLTPTPYQSGDGSPGTRDQQGGESAHPGGRHRDGLVLVAVSAAEPPEPLVSGALRPRGTRARKVGIVALARKLLIELWRFLEFGVVPEGAQAEDGVTGFPVGSGGTTE